MQRLCVLARLLVCVLFFLPLSLMAQDRTVKGTVLDEKGQPLSGAAILVKGSSRGATTDSAGNFTISVHGSPVLVISYVGMANKEVTVGGDNRINVTMGAEKASLDEVVVVGYGTSRKKDLTGAVASVKSQQLTQVATPDAVQAIQGRVSGVQVVANSGEPGSGSRIRIRGIGSVNGSNPIYVVDGYQTNDISYLAPGDIENMDILKDASASAIYGARGANGVVVVTTKKGRSGPVKFSFDGYTGLQTPRRKLKMTNASQYATLVEEAYSNDGVPVPTSFKQELDDALAGKYGNGTNWQDEVFQNGLMQNYSLGLAGGNDINRFRLSGTYFSQDGIIKNTGLKKYFFNFNDDITVNKWLRGGFNVAFSHADKTYYNGDLYAGILPNALSAEPLAPVRDPLTGNWGRATLSYANNPARVVDEIKGNRGYNSALVANVWAEAKILKGLSFRTQFGATYNNTHNTTYLPQFKIDNVEQRSQSSLYDYRGEETSWLWSNYFTYNQTFGAHNLSVLAGAELQNLNHEELAIIAYNVPADTKLQYITNAQSNTYTINPNGVTFPYFSNGLQSFFGRLNYSYASKYLFTATVRRDASSKFLGNNRSGVFPSFAGSWVVSEEGFMKHNRVISLLKLRAGWGEVGNEQSSNAYPYITGIGGNNNYTFNNTSVPGFAPITYGNSNLKWETSEQSNAGVDIGFLNNKLTVSADYFNRTTNDMILPVPTPVYSGAPAAPLMNTGTMQNKGVEFAISYSGGKAFKYTVGANFTYVSNKITSLGKGSVINGASTGKLGNLSEQQDGLPFPSYLGLKTDGIFHTQAELDAYKNKEGNAIQPNAQVGDVKFVDANGDGTISADDRVVLGNPNPKYQFGFNADFSYKNFDLHMFFQGVQGNKLVNALIYNTRAVSNGSSSWNNFETVRLDRWTPTNTNTNEPRMTVKDPNASLQQFSDRYVENGSYLRMKNIQLGYTLPKKVISNWGLNSLRFYLSVDNLFTITKYQGFDPEVTGYYSDPMFTGIDVGGYPQARTYRVGVNLGF
ncbi:SusC/RagA family TonB-linked outer membrane protein [Deminuibacter soli]|uniref:TonB-dependent receptor n=1 Tax=Deminuibacter soli TaxID=2291815 RepID=A0A3E1NFN5_9BACT|nr:TonB-dependent receptor [Deminuibacter soli]RFM26624.1 TonB-dependent receptor [Deminuibacter soli]